MAGNAGISGLAVAEIAAGLVFAWAGIENVPVSVVVRSLATGHLPAKGQPGNYVAGQAAADLPQPLQGEVTTGKLPAGGTDAANQALGRLLAATYGWGAGVNWTALDYGWGTLESGWNQLATNPGSGAFGIAQALGHGISGTAGQVDGREVNEYGPLTGMSFPNSLYIGANSGNPADQIRWGLQYIKDSYGQPSAIPGWTGGGNYGGY